METILICILAGFGAGLGTGFAGMSAAVVISPMLITLLDINPYEAIGIALSSDILASAIAAATYWKNKNIDIKNSLYLFFSVLLFTVIGSYISHQVPSTTIGNFSVYMSLLMGIKFLFEKEKNNNGSLNVSNNGKVLLPILCGAIIGFICGFIGAGGGIMMLILLTTVLGYKLKNAIGTSLFIMTFTALFGAGSHFYLGNSLPDIHVLLSCAISTTIFSFLASRFANKARPIVLKRVTGIVLTILGIFMITL